MAKDIIETVGEYLADDPAKWGKLASNIQWRRLQLVLLREILVELRKLNGQVVGLTGSGTPETQAGKSEISEAEA